MHRIEADLLIPGRGEPVSDGVVVLDGDRIGYAGPAAGAPETPHAARHRAVPSCPGCGTATGISSARAPSTSAGCRWSRSRCGRPGAPAICGTRSTPGSRRCARSAASGMDLARAVAEGVLDGPAVYAAGAILSTTGGHGDLHSYPLPWMEDYAALAGTMCLADGVAELPAGGARAAPPERPGHQGMRLRRRPVRARRPHPPAVHRRRAARHRRGGRPGRTASPRTATASRASWPRCRPGVPPSSTAPTSTTSAATPCGRRGAILVPTRTIIEEMLANRRGVPDYAAAKLRRIADGTPARSPAPGSAASPSRRAPTSR